MVCRSAKLRNWKFAPSPPPEVDREPNAGFTGSTVLDQLINRMLGVEPSEHVFQGVDPS